MLAEKDAIPVSVLDNLVGPELLSSDIVMNDIKDGGASVHAKAPDYEECMLIARLRAGEITAFDELVEKYQPLVYALAYRVLNNSEDAGDAAQETFLKVYRHFDRFRGEASLKTWVCRIAVNQAFSTRRWWRRRRRDDIESLDMPVAVNGNDSTVFLRDKIAGGGISPEAQTLRHERERQIEFALSLVKKDFRVAVILRDIEGLSYEEIAYVTEVSVGTVKSRIARGRDMLREFINR